MFPISETIVGLMRLPTEQEWTEKLWGRTKRIQESTAPADPEIWLLKGIKGGASSMHYHRHKDNYFFVINGWLQVTTRSGDMDEGRQDLQYDLFTCKSIVIPAGTIHRMEFRSDSTVIEAYVARNGMPANSADIHRFDSGWKPGEGPEV